MNENNGVIQCPHCGRNIKSDATFCYICGYNLITKKGGNVVPTSVSTKEDINQDMTKSVEENSNSVGKIVTGEIKSLLLYNIGHKIMGAIIILIVMALLFGGLATDGTKFWIYVIGAIVVLSVILVFVVKQENRQRAATRANLQELKYNDNSKYVLVIILLIIIAIIFFHFFRG